jgi:adenylate kinase
MMLYNTMTDTSFEKKICLFGPQGSGKGTQAKRLIAEFGVPHLSTGDIFRKAIADRSELGQKIEAIMKAGQLVPSEVTNAVMKERLAQEDCLNGFVLDGYPRNLIQAEALDGTSALTHVIVLSIPDEESIHRLSQRRVCVSCGATYHLDFQPPQQPNVCDSCGSELKQRDDDQPEAIAQRLHIYHAETQPLIARYKDRGLVDEIDGMGTIDEVWERVKSAAYGSHS